MVDDRGREGDDKRDDREMEIRIKKKRWNRKEEH